MPAFLSLWAGRRELEESYLLIARCQACLLLEGWWLPPGRRTLSSNASLQPFQLAWVESAKQFLVSFCMSVVLEMVPRLTLNWMLPYLDISALWCTFRSSFYCFLAFPLACARNSAEVLLWLLFRAAASRAEQAWRWEGEWEMSFPKVGNRKAAVDCSRIS